MFTRRDFVGLAAAGYAAAGSARPFRIESTFGGVKVGAQTYSFRDRPVDEAIQAMREIGLGYAELTQRHVQP